MLFRPNRSWSSTSVFSRSFWLQRARRPDVSPFAMFTGEAPPSERTANWERAQVIFATPQVVKIIDLAGRYTLNDVTLMIVDRVSPGRGH